MRTSFLLRVLALSTVVATAFGSPAAAQDVIKVGAPLPLTGPLSPEGLKQKRGYDLWAETANAKGGIKAGGKTYKVEIVYADYASNTPRAVQTAERMITEDKVNFLFAPFGSGATKAASAISEKYQIPMLARPPPRQEIFDQGFKYIFSTLTGNETVSVPIAKLVAAKNKDIKRVAVLARNDLFPLAVAQEFEKAVKAEGMEVVAVRALRHRRDGPFRRNHADARCAIPTGFYASGYINDLILIRKQMNDLGLKAPVITLIAGPAYAEFAKTVGPLADNITSMSWWHPAVRYKGQDVFGSTEAFNAACAKEVRRRGRLHRRRLGRRWRHPANGDREGRHRRSGEGARRARGDSMSRPSTVASSSMPAVRSTRCSRRYFN